MGTTSWRQTTTGLAALAVFASGCSGGGSAPDDPSASLAADAQAPPAMTTTLDVADLPPAEPVLGFDAEEADPPRPHLQDLVAGGVAAGRWTEAEGVGQALRWAAGEVPDDDLADLVVGARKGQEAALLQAIDDALRLVPRPLRGVVKRVILP